MKKTLATALLITAASLALAACSQKPAETAEAPAETTEAVASETAGEAAPVMVGGAPMYANKNVVENASTAPNLKTLVAAVTAAGLAETLSGPGPFTVFAPDDGAFGKLPAGTVETLVKPESKETLTGI
ncbi:MAG: fasciclin domain-containing protein, partial [Pseudomonadota bacterium]